ncbi:hypothetical protein V8D89_007729 [Ganoderma adspersum]
MAWQVPLYDTAPPSKLLEHPVLSFPSSVSSLSARPPSSEVLARPPYIRAAIAIDHALGDRYYVRSQARSDCFPSPVKPPPHGVLYRSHSHDDVHRDESHPLPLCPPRVRPGDAPVHARALDGVHQEGGAPRPPRAALQVGLGLIEHHRQLGEPTTGRRRRARLCGPASAGTLVDRASEAGSALVTVPPVLPLPRTSQDGSSGGPRTGYSTLHIGVTIHAGGGSTYSSKSKSRSSAE